VNWLDYAIIAIIAISISLSVWRGFFKEALSLFTWIAALIVGFLFYEPTGDLLSGLIASPTIRYALAFSALFLAVLILGALLTYLLSQLVTRTGLTGTDRALGIIFGIARGIVIVVLLVMLAGLTTLPQEQWWTESMLVHQFQDLAVWAREFLPDTFRQHITFEQA
jgi:membrane protein required for colicin V production